MTIKNVEPKCFILALFIRNDGARFLLGSGAYEFKDSQQHFAANTMENDVVEVQGNDGYLLAGQVRRPGAQSFDGYVGDSSTSKPAVESLRREFFQFFRKGYFYKVVYVFPDGSAIQRKRGFLVDAPVVQELYQIYPEYHVALNFEDINYYYYNENADGDEIYGKSATIGLSMASGGLVWDALGAVAEEYTWTTPVTVSGSEITDTTLIGQLDALEAMKLFAGENNLLVTASGTNLPAELEMSYYTEIQDGYGFVWDDGRAPSHNITVDSIDNVYPVLTITGEAINPIITNVTTGTMLQYNGTVTASQTLVIDMMNQTATLNGTSVIGNVSGDWLYFAPGNNRVEYTATNANAPDATIEWQEIVG